MGYSPICYRNCAKKTQFCKFVVQAVFTFTILVVLYPKGFLTDSQARSGIYSGHFLSRLRIYTLQTIETEPAVL